MSTGIGDALREAREDQGRTLEDAAHALRLRSEQVRALEEERFGSFGGDVYARGFLKSYALELGLDPQPLLDTYRREVSSGDPITSAPLIAPGSSGNLATRRNAPPGWIAWVLVGVVVLVGLGLVGQFVGNRAPEQASSEPTEAPVAPADDGATPSEPDPEPEPEPEPTEQPEPTYDGVELFLALEADSWLQVTVDGTVVFEKVAAQGETLTYRGEEQVSVRYGNAGGVRVELNGEDLGTPGPNGAVVDVDYTPDGQSEV